MNVERHCIGAARLAARDSSATPVYPSRAREFGQIRSNPVGFELSLHFQNHPKTEHIVTFQRVAKYKGRTKANRPSRIAPGTQPRRLALNSLLSPDTNQPSADRNGHLRTLPVISGHLRTHRKTGSTLPSRTPRDQHQDGYAARPRSVHPWFPAASLSALPSRIIADNCGSSRIIADNSGKKYFQPFPLPLLVPLPLAYRRIPGKKSITPFPHPPAPLP